VGLYAAEKKNFGKNSLDLQEGDRIILFSDGYTDQIGGEHIKKLKSSGLQKFIQESLHLSVSEQGAYLENKFKKYKGQHQQMDDTLLVIIEFKNV